MPSRRPILTDIHDLKLDPNRSHHSTERNGRLSKPIKGEKFEKSSLAPQAKTVVEPVVLQPEPEQPISDIIDDLIDVKQESVELLDLVQEQPISDIRNALTFLPETVVSPTIESSSLKKTEEKIEQSQEKKKKFVKNVKSNTNS